jgi:Mrp family chromosome partitioning ATPase
MRSQCIQSFGLLIKPMVEAYMNLSPAVSNRQPLQILTGPESRQVFLGIYDNILLTSGVTRQKSFLVCSANRGEGASTVALGIALAAAEIRNQPVLIIDANFSHPQVCKAFFCRNSMDWATSWPEASTSRAW